MSVSSAGPSTAVSVRPFLKWAGGKRQLLDALRPFIPRQFGAYHDPFLGSGAVVFDRCRNGLLASRRCRLTDVNVDCFRAVASDVDAVIAELWRLTIQHVRDGDEAYYRVRDRVFNPKRRAPGNAADSR